MEGEKNNKRKEKSSLTISAQIQKRSDDCAEYFR